MSRRSRHWQGAPAGVGVHVAVLGAIVLLALFATEPPAPPHAAPLVLQVASPPPPPLRRGDAVVPVAPAPPQSQSVPRSLPDESAFRHIPESVLAPRMSLDYGFVDGVLDGELTGMRDGIPGGVVGGVPGGVVGGVIGGTGSTVPRFPKPDVGPSPIRMPQPSYSEAAIRNNVTGSVVLRVVIDERGSVSVLEVLRSVPELDEEAVRVVESDWLFQPATKNGRPVSTLSNLRVIFQLH